MSDLNVNELIDQAMTVRPGFSMDRFAQSLLDKFGGEEGLADKALAEFQAADEGSNTRKSILEMVFKTMIATAPKGADELDLESLKTEAKALLGVQ